MMTLVPSFTFCKSVSLKMWISFYYILCGIKGSLDPILRQVLEPDTPTNITWSYRLGYMLIF